MDARSFMRTGVGVAVVCAALACGSDDPTKPGAGPTLTSIDPGSGAAGARARIVPVTLTGAGFGAEDVAVHVSGSMVEVANVSVLDDTRLTADFIIAGGATTGDRSVSVSTVEGWSGSVTFRVGRDRAVAESHVIEMYDNYPAPTYLKIEAGGSVLWTNVGHHDHTVSTYGTPGEWQNTVIEPGTSFYHTFDQPGEYGFICAFHQEIGFVSVRPRGSMTDPGMDGDMGGDMAGDTMGGYDDAGMDDMMMMDDTMMMSGP